MGFDGGEWVRPIPRALRRLSSGEQRSDSGQIFPNAIAFRDAYHGRIDQFVRHSRLAGGHHTLEKQFHESGCNY